MKKVSEKLTFDLPAFRYLSYAMYCVLQRSCSNLWTFYVKLLCLLFGHFCFLVKHMKNFISWKLNLFCSGHVHKEKNCDAKNDLLRC